jgi:hypothetical protein
MKLRMVTYDDRIRKELRDWLEDDIEQETTLLTLSNFLFWIGDFNKSEKYKYDKLLHLQQYINIKIIFLVKSCSMNFLSMMLIDRKSTIIWATHIKKWVDLPMH